jgi:vWA-MoxR associated protein C-terminal domain/Caspase domain
VIAPDRTYAVVVGIERYDAGDKWDLDGAAESALRIIGWLRKCHVPAENITVLLSPLNSNRSKVEQTLADLGFPAGLEPATVENVRQVVTEQLPEHDENLLVLFWSGHGVLDHREQRRLFCADAGVHAKYNINVTDLLAALSGKSFRGLRDQVIIVDACANFIQEMRLNLQAPESEFALGDTRWVSRDGLLAASQGERALLDRKASFGNVVADWLDQHAYTLPPPMDQLAADVDKRFEQLRADGVTAQHPVRIREILHGNETEHVFGGEPVPESVLRSARSAGLTTAQLRATAAAIAATPQLATERGREALMEALRGVVGPVARTDDPEADLLDLVSAVLDRQAGEALFGALLDIATSDSERIAAVAVRHRWELQAAVAPLLGMLRRTPLVQVLGALAGTVGDVPAGITDFDEVLELLADLSKSRLSTSPLAEFVVRLQRRRPDMEVPDGWFSSQGLEEVAVAALRTSVAKEAGMRYKLVIDLGKSTPGAWQAELTGYFGPGWYRQTVKCEPTADGVRRAVVKIVEWARGQAADFAIGFLLGLGMLPELPEQWEYEDVVMTRTQLCQEYPVVLHAAERMTIRQLQLAWDSKLSAIEASAGGAPKMLWLDEDDATAVRRTVQNSDDAYVAFSFVPQTRAELKATAPMAAIAAGAPYVMWVQAAPATGYDLRTHLGDMVGPIRDFPATLRQGRRSDPYLSGALRVIWDSLDELPPYLDRLGEELVPNG